MFRSLKGREYKNTLSVWQASKFFKKEESTVVDETRQRLWEELSFELGPSMKTLTREYMSR